MKVVVDTNVIVSAIISPGGPPGALLAAWRDGGFQLITSPSLLRELDVVLSRPALARRYKVTQAEREQLLAEIAEKAVLVEPEQTLSVIHQDPSDDRVLEAAMAGGADYVVSGDAHLLALSEHEGIAIVPPVRFWAMLRSEQA